MIAAFDPAIDPRALRPVLGRFPTGITVITIATHQGPLGFTANSFASISLDPPLVMWAPARSSGRHDAFVAARDFAINILAEPQRDLCDHFVGHCDGFDAFAHRLNDAGVPLFDGCAATLECRREEVHVAGDHTIVLGRVMRAQCEALDPLIFHGGRIGRLLAT